MFGPSVKKVNRGGRIVYVVQCSEARCKHEAQGTTKSEALRELKKHDRSSHQRDRERAKQVERKDKDLKAKQAKALAREEARAKVDKARAAAQEKADKARSQEGWNTGRSASSGLKTKGIPGVPDGQKVTGKVYDDKGKVVPYDVLKKHVQGWD